MADHAAFRFGVVCEAPADRETGCDLADRVLQADIDWITAKSLDSHRAYQGLTPAETYLAWQSVPRLARQRGIKLHGFFGDEPGKPDALTARKALTLFVVGENLPDAVFLLRDADHQAERRQGLEQARRYRAWPFPVVVGLADPNRECWVLAGFNPSDEAEGRSLQEVTRDLGFDPRSNAHELTAQQSNAKRSAKRVLSILTGADRDRQRECWRLSSLETLEQRGSDTGLATFLGEVRERVVPLVRGR